MGPVLVFGHRNPDNDSVCAAVGYAHLKNLTDPDSVYVPARLGSAPPETTWVFSRFGVQLPERIEDVHARARDVMSDGVKSVREDATMLDAGRVLREEEIRGLPVLDDDGRVTGIVSSLALAQRYVDDIELRGFESMPVSVHDLAHVLNARVLVGDPDDQLSGNVLIGAMEPETVLSYIQPGDTLIVGDRVRTQPMALDAGVGCLIVTGGRAPRDDVLELARARGAAVVLTEHDTFSAARLVSLARTVGEVMDRDILLVSPDALLSETAEDLLASRHREAVVVDEGLRPLGIITRTDLARGRGRRVVLVDHNEASQSASGIEEAEVLEVVDHHRIGDIQTRGPILFLNLPVGSTSSIVARRYQDLGVAIPEPIAGILLSAVLTDTVLLKSPTTTDADRRVVDELSRIAGVEAMEFGLEVFRAKASGQAFDAERLVRADLKEYRVGERTVAIGQFETVDLASVMEHAAELTSALDGVREQSGCDVVVLMLTDILREGSQILASGSTRLVERGLGVSLADGSAWLPGVLSRKKQVVSRLIDTTGTSK